MALACKQIQTEFSALLDDELDQEDRELVEEHLSECADCLRELHGFKQVTDAYRYHHPAKAPDDFEERFREALAPQVTRLRPPWSPWRFAAAAVVLLGISLSLWRMVGQDTDLIQLSKNTPEMADEAVASPPSPAALQTMAGEADLDQSSRGDGASAEMDFYGTPAMLEEEVGTSAVGSVPLEDLESALVLKKEIPSSRAVPARERREVSVDGAFATTQSSQPAAPPMEERISVAAELADTAPSPALESVVMKDDATTDGIASGLLEAKAEQPRKALAVAEKGSLTALQWREKSFVLENGTLQQADYDGEALKDTAIPSDTWTALLDRFPDLTQLVSGTKKVIVKLDKTWYQIAVSPSNLPGPSPK